MKKMAIGVIIVVVLLVLTVSVAMAEKPDGVDKAVRVDWWDEDSYYWPEGIPGFFYCFLGMPECSVYQGPCFSQHSNDAQGHVTNKCKMDLVWGDPVYDYFHYVGNVCELTYSYEGNKLIRTSHCINNWYNP